MENLIEFIKHFLKPNLVTPIHCLVEDLYDIKNTLLETFNIKFVYTKIYPRDVINVEDQRVILEQTHNRAHRNYREDMKQIEKVYYWPQMRKN